MFDPENWPPFARLLDRPAPVWLPARRLWPEAPDASYVGNPDGLMTGWEIPGVVHALLPTMYGSQLAVVTCQLQTRSGEWGWTAQAQLVSAHLLSEVRAPQLRPLRDRWAVTDWWEKLAAEVPGAVAGWDVADMTRYSAAVPDATLTAFAVYVAGLWGYWAATDAAPGAGHRARLAREYAAWRLA